MTAPPECDPDHFFTCLDGKCIPLGYLCDGKQDCDMDDNSDELNCNGKNINTLYFLDLIVKKLSLLSYLLNE